MTSEVSYNGASTPTPPGSERVACPSPPKNTHPPRGAIHALYSTNSTVHHTARYRHTEAKRDSEALESRESASIFKLFRAPRTRPSSSGQRRGCGSAGATPDSRRGNMLSPFPMAQTRGAFRAKRRSLMLGVASYFGARWESVCNDLLRTTQRVCASPPRGARPPIQRARGGDPSPGYRLSNLQRAVPRGL